MILNIFFIIINFFLLSITSEANISKFNYESTCTFGHVSNGTHCQECGLTEIQPNIKVVGGIDAKANSWPAQVSIRQSIKFDRTLPNQGVSTISAAITCGATLINHYTILTAAHCILTSYYEDYENETYVYTIQPNEYFPTWESMFDVYLGAHNLKNSSEPSLTRRVRKIIKHPDYNNTIYQNDIAILILENPVEYSKYIKPACLPKQPKYALTDDDCYAVGWGTTTEYGNQSINLQNVKLKIYNETYCSKVLPFLPKDWDIQVCAGNYSGGQDTCQGDSGSGLYVYDSSTEMPRWVVYGIVSYGEGCARKELPGVYTRVSYYLDWIYKNWMVTEYVPTTTIKITTTKEAIFFNTSTKVFCSLISFTLILINLCISFF